MEHAIVYADSLALCLILGLILFLFNLKNWKSNYINTLSCSYVLVFLSLLSDIIWIFIDGNPSLIGFNYFLNVIEFSSFGLMGACWMCHCLTVFPLKFCKTRWAKIVFNIPVAIVTILIALSPWIKLIFYIDSNGFYCRGPAFFLQQTGYLYLLVASTLAVISRQSVFLTSQKVRFTVIALFPLPALLLGTLQLLMPPGSLPTLQFSVILSLLIVYITDLERKVTHDSLTNLMNRYEFERVLYDRMSRCRPGDENSLFVVMGDMDCFKQINDTYGHLEGDRILQLVAGILDRAGQKYDAVVARMAGDEFLMLLESKTPEAAEAYCQEVSQQLDAFSREHRFRVSISLGAVRYDSAMSLTDLLGAADNQLYLKKHEKKLMFR